MQQISGIIYKFPLNMRNTVMLNLFQPLKTVRAPETSSESALNLFQG